MNEDLKKLLDDTDAKMISSVKQQLDELSEIVGESFDKELNQDKRKAVIEGKRQALEFYKELSTWVKSKLGEEIKEELATSPVERRVRRN